MKEATCCCVLVLCLVLRWASACEAGLSIDDLVVVEGETALLRAQARGWLFPLGGVLVDFFVDGKKVGTNLSGGDGSVYLEFQAKRRGLHSVSAVYREMRAEGALLVLKEGTAVVFVDVMGSMMKDPLGRELRDGCRAEVEKIARRYPIVFLSVGIAPPSMLKTWLGEHEFGDPVVVSWNGGRAFADAVDRGLHVRAVIGGPEVVESARGRAKGLYSFEDVQGAVQVRTWSEISQKVR